VLDRLQELGLRATFFCLGSRVREAPELVAETLLRGHEIGVHGHVHDHHFARHPGWVRADLDAALEALADCGVEPRWYRPPYGQVSAGTLRAARRRGLELVHWSAWGREWEEPDGSSVAERVSRSLEPGAIVLLHDSDFTSPTGTVDRVLDALGDIAADLERRGLAATTLTELVPRSS
jgi:peptidoglycan/xylan/chitin deacetylase (PgdA/CDA1 family)